MDREAWRAVGHGVAKSQRQLSDWIELKNYVSFILYINKIFNKYICIFKYMQHAFYFQRVSLPAHYCLSLTLRRLSHSLSFFFNWRIIALQCCVDFCHTTCESAISIPSLLRLLPLPRPTLLGHHWALGWAPCVLYGNFPLLSISHMVNCMFPCYSLNFSHLHLLLVCSHVSMSVSLFLPCK